jgi:hypothetical protein
MALLVKEESFKEKALARLLEKKGLERRRGLPFIIDLIRHYD